MFYEPHSQREFASLDEFRAAHPHTSFGELLGEPERNAAGLFLLDDDRPSHNRATHTLEPAGIEPQGGGWVRRWVAVALPAPEMCARLRSALAAGYERRMQIIASGYPPSERESWPVQTGEARALLADFGATTPWIDAAAAVRGVDRLELAARIAAKDGAYRAIHGALTGARQRIEDAIDAAGDDAEALAAIDVAAGWPETGDPA